MTTVGEKKTGTLDVPGASLHYEIYGAGPTLLMISPGHGDSGAYSSVAEILSDEYLVLTFDRRGDSSGTVPVAARTEDARHILEAFGEPPAYVFGGSGGAVVTLDLAARYPSLVNTVIAHEPPLVTLLPDAAELNAFTEPTAPHELLPFTRYAPNVAALRRSGRRIVIGGGAASGDHTYPYRGGVAVSELLESEFAVFPGDHAGYVGQPREFAATLRRLLHG